MMKESMEFLVGVETLVDAGKAVFADGKIDLGDLKVAMDLAPKLGLLVAAGEGVEKIPSEVPQYSVEDMKAIVEKVHAIMKKARA